jgi:hypothetical protein
MADKDFLAASPADQHAYLSETDKDYAAASPGDQAAFLSHVTGKPVGEYSTLSVPRPQVNMRMSPLGAEPQGMPGASEGAGLAEGLSEYDKAVAGGAASGARNLASGNISRGTHELIGAAGNALAPTVPFAVAGAPVAALGAYGGGVIGGKLAEKGAQVLGATPDQTALAGDVGNIAGGFAGGALGHYGAKAMPGATRARAKAGFNEVARVANPSVVDTSEAGNIALDIQREAASGGQQPKVIRDFVNRVTDPKKGPLTYEEARRFYSNASNRLAPEESMRLTGTQKRLLAQFAEKLDKAITATAETHGKGEQYTGAMKDYRRASRAQDVVDTAKDIGLRSITKAAAPGLIGYGLYRALK